MTVMQRRAVDLDRGKCEKRGSGTPPCSSTAGSPPRLYVCPICCNERELDEDALVDGAELKGATPLMEFAGERAMTFSH